MNKSISIILVVLLGILAVGAAYVLYEERAYRECLHSYSHLPEIEAKQVCSYLS